MVVNKMRRVMCNKIQKDEVETGDHIYTLRDAHAKPHHGIYVSDKEVIHFNEKAWSGHRMCTTGCYHPLALSSSIDCFLSGGDLYRFEYSVNPAHYLAKCGKGCTLASADRAKDVKLRASFLLNEGYGACYRYINSGEDFAIFCKTGLLVVDMINFNRRWQIAYFLAVTASVYLSLQQFVPVSFTFTGVAARILCLYCICIFAPDIGARPNVIKIDKVHTLPEVDQILAFGHGDPGFQPIESYINVFLFIMILAFFVCLLSTFWCEPLQRYSWTFRVVWTQACIIIFHWAVLQRVIVLLGFHIEFSSLISSTYFQFSFLRVQSMLNNIQKLISNKIQKEQLMPGDHIYTWRNGYSYAHHGIYVGDGIGKEVIHVVRGEDPFTPSSSSPSHSDQLDNSTNTELLAHDCRVAYCSLDRFVDGGELNLYKYGVKVAFFLAKTRGGTCIHIKADPPREVVHRARFLQAHNNFGAYNLINNNCEDFAVYCKTVLPPKGIVHIRRNGQIAFFYAAFYAISIPITTFSPVGSTSGIDWEKQLAALVAVLYRDFISLAMTAYILFCMMRIIGDFAFVTGNFKVQVQKMTPYSKMADWLQSNFCQYTLSSLN